VDPRGVVFLDTETSGLAGGTGTVIFLLGLARLAGDALVVRQYMLTAFSGEAAMLESAAEWVGGLEGMVTYNGRSFDLPLVAARCRLTGVTDRFSHLRHLDLLPPTRRAFARRWGDCRLTTAERRLLRFERENDLPGWAAPESWFAYVRHGDATRLPLVAEHNFHDVVTLAALVPALADAHAEPGAFEADILAVARAFERYGASGRAYRLLEEHEAMLDTDGLLELARYYRASNDWPRACEIWQRLAARGVAEAVERLAKYHEHVRRDYAAALALAERLPPVPDHDRRRHRLRRKLEQNGQEPR
ncbi:MAG TPA: ribonuclease H-like domain-containing protein, partial [Longimicrobiales bacterium]|nr:ribonuclease H-like domain-containing protein [Longimicrobiales bacterium]